MAKIKNSRANHDGPHLQLQHLGDGLLCIASSSIARTIEKDLVKKKVKT